jgi:hypothetical protein
MKINDIISEAYKGFVGGHLKDYGTVKRGIDQAIPNARIEPEVRNTDTYMQMRYGIALAAAAAAGDDEFQQESAWAENLGMVGYSDADIEIMDAADKLMGVKSIKLSGKSKERDDIGNKSPVADTSWKKSNK